jgi:hypothetical protein
MWRRWAARSGAWARRHRFWSYPPFGWIAYLPLLVVYLALLAVIMGVGAILGAPGLIWHDLPGTQIVAGFSIALLGFQLSMVGYLLDTRENPNEDVAPDVATFESIARYVRWPLVVLFAAVVIGFVRLHARTPHAGLVLIGPVLMAAAVVVLRRGPMSGQRLLDLFAEKRHDRMRGFFERQHRLAAEPRTSAPDPGAHVVQAIVMLVLAVAYVLVWAFKRYVPAALAVGLAVALGIGIFGLLRFWFRRYRFFWTALLIVLACSIGVTGDIPVTGLSNVGFPKEGARPRELLDDVDVLERWKAQFQEDKPRLVVVATSGGALRAALWTINILRDLELRFPGFLRHVRLVTGASGGMVGAAHLVSALEQLGPTPPPGRLSYEWFDAIMEDAAKDSLTAVTRALLLPRSDRGRALEDSWEDHTNDRLAMPFRTLLAGERAGWLPSLVYSPVLVEDGRRLVVSNLELGSIVDTLAPGPTGSHLQSISAVQLFACTGNGIDPIKLSTIARLNATFPWVTSAALLTTTPDRRVVDAGYYDNYGVDVATAWIRKNAVWLERNTSGVLLLQIRDATTAETDVAAEPGPGLVHRWASALTTPIEGFLSAWNASMSFRNDREVEVLADELSQLAGGRFFLTAAYQFPDRAPLEWYLSRQSIDVLKRSPQPSAFDSIYQWWTPPAR